MIGHRSKTYAALHESIVQRMQAIMYTKNPVFLGTCSATGLIEAAFRNAVQKKVLVTVNGFFSKKWAKIAESCGVTAVVLDVGLGRAVTPAMVEEKLRQDPEIDAVFLTHSETSTGVLSPLKEIAAVIKKFPDVVLITDVVSSFAATEVRVDEWGIDMILFGLQKALACPPGIAICSVSPRILARSHAMPAIRKGYYFDFVEWEKLAMKHNTPITPPVSLMYALDAQLDRILKESMERRWKRHKAMQRLTQKWAAKHGLTYFSEHPYHSPGVSVINNDKGWDIAALNQHLTEKHDCVIANGYSELKDKTFRIGHMGDHKVSTIKKLLAWIDEFVG